MSDLKQINRMASYAPLEWPDNIDISDAPPSEHVPVIRQRFPVGEWSKMEDAHARPAGWEGMEYTEFLDTRRQLMASIIRRGFETLHEDATR